MVTAASVEAEYRAAFEDFSRKAQRVQALTERPTGDRKAFETALLELEKAHLAYGEARDGLIESMFPSQQHSQRNRASENRHSDIQTIAELLWESAGRPAGTEEEDWQRAEAIVQCAVAATACA